LTYFPPKVVLISLLNAGANDITKNHLKVKIWLISQIFPLKRKIYTKMYLEYS